MNEEDMLNLSGKAWVPIPRIARTIPFGYYVSEKDPDTLVPNIFELEALEMAKKHRKKGHSFARLAPWLENITGRKISPEGLRKRVESDSRRRRKAQVIAQWARKYKEAIEKVKDFDQRTGESTIDYGELVNDAVYLSAVRTRDDRPERNVQPQSGATD